MRITDAQLKGLPVFTESGIRAGKLSGIIIDVETHEVAQYAVSRPRSIRSPLPKMLLVGRDQVLSIDEERVVVRDGSIEAAERTAVAATSTAGVAGVSRMDVDPASRREN